LNKPPTENAGGVCHHLHAFVDIFVESQLMDEVVEALTKLQNVEDFYEVTGEFDIVTLVSAADKEEFREILKNKVMKIPGVKALLPRLFFRRIKVQNVETDPLNKIVNS